MTPQEQRTADCRAFFQKNVRYFYRLCTPALIYAMKRLESKAPSLLKACIDGTTTAVYHMILGG